MIFETDVLLWMASLAAALAILEVGRLGLVWWWRRGRVPVLRGKVTFNGFTAGPLRTAAKLRYDEEKKEMDVEDFGARISASPYLAFTLRDPVHGRLTLRVEDTSDARELLHDLANVGERWRLEFHRERAAPRLRGRIGVKETPFGTHAGGGI